MSIQKKSFGGIVLNTGCSLQCVFCGGLQKASDIKLKKEEVAVYKNLQHHKKGGVQNIEISGSDPMEYDKIIDLVRYIKDEGFESVRISSNGIRLIDPSFSKSLAMAGLNKIRIPIYGSNATIHESVTGKPGSFNQTVWGIKNLLEKNYGIEIQISCLITKKNKDNLFEIVDFINALKIKDFYFSIPCVLPEKDLSFYLPLKDLSPYIKEIYPYALKINKETMFLEIPFCVFGVFNQKNINNICAPPDMGKYNQPMGKYRTPVPSLPSYRVKKKISMCNECKASNNCDGFFVNDIDKFGVGKLKPIK